MATDLYKKRRRRKKRKSRKTSARTISSNQTPQTDSYRLDSYRAVREAQQSRTKAASAAYKLRDDKISDLASRKRDFKSRWDTSRQTPNKPAYAVAANQYKQNSSAVRSSSLGKRKIYKRMWRGALSLDCAEKPNPSEAGKARQKQRRLQQAKGAGGGRIPKHIQKQRRAKRFRVWCQ